MRLIDAGMLAFAGWHALKGRVDWPLTFHVPRMLRSTLRDEGPDTYALFWNAVQFRADGWEADEALAGDEADGIPGVVSPSTARELIGSRGHLEEWIDRDLRVADEVREAVEENRDRLRLNLRLVDLSEEAVGAPPAPLEPAGPLGEGGGDWERARERPEGVSFR